MGDDSIHELVVFEESHQFEHRQDPVQPDHFGKLNEPKNKDATLTMILFLTDCCDGQHDEGHRYGGYKVNQKPLLQIVVSQLFPIDDQFTIDVLFDRGKVDYNVNDEDEIRATIKYDDAKLVFVDIHEGQTDGQDDCRVQNQYEYQQ